MVKLELKKKFIENEIWILTFGGAFQRANIYKENVSDNQKRELRNYIKNYVCKLVAEKYKKNCSEKDHSKNILNLCSLITDKFKNILKDNKFRIGIGQKLLNLYLKYLWCMNQIQEPPHCPFDRIIISKLGINDINWTDIENIEVYNGLVQKAKIKAKNISIAEWELTHFNRRDFD